MLLFLSCQKCSCYNQNALLSQAGFKVGCFKLETLHWCFLSSSLDVFSIIPILFLSRTKSEVPEKKTHKEKLLWLEAGLPDITPKDLLLSHFQSVKLLSCHVFIFVSTSSMQWSQLTPLKRQRTAVIAIKHSSFKTYAGNTMSRNVCMWMAHSHLSVYVCGILSFTGNPRKANAL